MTDSQADQRRAALDARRSMSHAERANASARIVDRLLRTREFRSANRIACYLPMADEVDTGELIRRAWCANKRIFVPLTAPGRKLFFREIGPDSEVARNAYGLFEPGSGDFIEPRSLQLVVTPTVAFDSERRRIGMGGGFYDRCFAFLRHRKYWHQPKLFGVAFACQQVGEIAANPWDIRLCGVVTEA